MSKFIFTLIAIFTLNTSFAQSKGQMDNRIDESSLPKDILNKDLILIVKIPFDTKTWEEKYTKVMEEHYAGKFIVVPYKTHIDENYPDTKIYKYILAVPHALNKKDFTGANAEIANETKGLVPTSAWSKDFHIVSRKNSSDFWNTNLSGQNDLKVLGYLADRLSGKEGGE